MKISVITPTIRKEGLPLVQKALERQDFDDFEWLIGSPFDPEMGTWVKDDFTGGFSTLHRIDDKLFREAKGELIVCLQDHTFCSPDALSKYWFWYQTHPNWIITGVGDKYDKVYPELGTKVWLDPRKRNTGDCRACNFVEIEGNFCSVPKKALSDINGFATELDYLGYNLDWVCVMERLRDLGGYEFRIDETNESFSETHGRVVDWEEHNLMYGGYEKWKAEKKAEGKWPIL